LLGLGLKQFYPSAENRLRLVERACPCSWPSGDRRHWSQPPGLQNSIRPSRALMGAHAGAAGEWAVALTPEGVVASATAAPPRSRLRRQCEAREVSTQLNAKTALADQQWFVEEVTRALAVPPRLRTSDRCRGCARGSRRAASPWWLTRGELADRAGREGSGKRSSTTPTQSECSWRTPTRRYCATGHCPTPPLPW
jgi:hypothetical protein